MNNAIATHAQALEKTRDAQVHRAVNGLRLMGVPMDSLRLVDRYDDATQLEMDGVPLLDFVVDREIDTVRIRVERLVWKEMSDD